MMIWRQMVWRQDRTSLSKVLNVIWGCSCSISPLTPSSGMCTSKSLISPISSVTPFNVRLNLCVAPFKLPWELRLCDIPGGDFWQACNIQKCSPNQLMSCNFCKWAEQTNWGGGLCSRPVSCGRSRMVNWSWRDSSWQQHSLGHEHKLAGLRNKPTVTARSRSLKFTGITLN